MSVFLLQYIPKEDFTAEATILYFMVSGIAVILTNAHNVKNVLREMMLHKVIRSIVDIKDYGRYFVYIAYTLLRYIRYEIIPIMCFERV